MAALMLAAQGVEAAEIRVAVAANFRATLEALAAPFEVATGHVLRPSAGSTGMLYAQIRHGAPYDVFLAADRQRPGLLEAEGATDGPPVTYAAGRLVLIGASGPQALAGIRTLSIANPRTAPYGAAAQQVVDRLGPFPDLRVAEAQSIAGVTAAVGSGAAEAGLAARSLAPEGWLVPADWHDPLMQDAVVLARARDRQAARAFLDWLTGPEGRALIAAGGYDVP